MIDDSLERARLHPDVLKNLNKNKKLKVAEAYSEDNPPPYPVTSVNNKTGAVSLGKSDVGLGSVDNVKQYSADNPPPYPVTKVNNKTGAVTLGASDVGALPNTTHIPSKTSDLTNDSGFVNAEGAMKFRPNGQGVAFGKAAEYDKTFEVTSDWTTRLGGNLIVDGLPGYKDLHIDANGQNWYIKVATITITGPYADYPLVFEFVGRRKLYSVVQIRFANANNTDPGISSFTSSNDRDFYVRKTATSTWELIAKYSEVWGDMRLCRYFKDNHKADVTINWTNIGKSAPSGLAQCASELLDVVYPVGSIYMSANSTSPATLFGGTWERIQDRFLLAAGSTYAAGSTGGASAVTLTTDQIPSHSHSISSAIGWPVNANAAEHLVENWGHSAWPKVPQITSTGNAGGGKAHNNMPPYLAVYMWKRTA